MRAGLSVAVFGRPPGPRAQLALEGLTFVGLGMGIDEARQMGEGAPDVFVHMETLRRYGIAELRPGQTVLVRFGPGPKGLMAAEVRPDGGTIGLASH